MNVIPLVMHVEGTRLVSFQFPLRTTAVTPAVPVDMGGRLDQLSGLAGRALVAIGVYLAVATITNLIAEQTNNPWLRRIVRVATPRFLTSLLVGIIATATPVAAQTDTQGQVGGGTTGAPSYRADDPPVMQVVEQPSRPVTSIPWITSLDRTAVDPPRDPTQDDGPPTTRAVTGSSTATTVAGSVDDEEDGSMHDPGPATVHDPGPATVHDPGPGPTADEPAPPTTRDAAPVHTVIAGEHLWSIAQSVVEQAGLDDSDETSVARYWSTLIEANRDRLIQPGNPDLIMPGQELIIPPIG